MTDSSLKQIKKLRTRMKHFRILFFITSLITAPYCVAMEVVDAEPAKVKIGDTTFWQKEGQRKFKLYGKLKKEINVVIKHDGRSEARSNCDFIWRYAKKLAVSTRSDIELSSVSRKKDGVDSSNLYHLEIKGNGELETDSILYELNALFTLYRPKSKKIKNVPSQAKHLETVCSCLQEQANEIGLEVTVKLSNMVVVEERIEERMEEIEALQIQQENLRLISKLLYPDWHPDFLKEEKE